MTSNLDKLLKRVPKKSFLFLSLMFQEGFLHENYDNGILEKENFS
jgi:hypothetical protein